MTGRGSPLRLLDATGGPRATPPSPRLLYWSDTTRGQAIETGIQRVTRRLAAGLQGRGAEVVPVGWNGRDRLMRMLDATRTSEVEAVDWLLLPEIPLGALAEHGDPMRLGRAYGLRTAAIVHDLIPLRHPQLYGEERMATFRRYYGMFADADIVFATTRLVAGQLREHLAGEGLTTPEIAVVPLPAQFAAAPRSSEARPPGKAGAPLRLLVVSGWEPRKNLLRLLRAVKRAQPLASRAIELTLVGLRGLFPAHDAEVDAELAGLPDVRMLGHVPDARLIDLAMASDAMVYPSLDEGFGMPILESLWLGCPCLCHHGSVMAEVAPGGGTLMIDMSDEGIVAASLRRLCDEADLLPRLASEAAGRTLRTWDDYAGDVLGTLEHARVRTA